MIRRLYAQYGIKALFTGLVPRLIKVAPACAIMISTFEHGKIAFNRLGSYKYNSANNEPILSNIENFQNITKSKDITSKALIRDINVSTKTDVL